MQPQVRIMRSGASQGACSRAEASSSLNVALFGFAKVVHAGTQSSARAGGDKRGNAIGLHLL